MPSEKSSGLERLVWRLSRRCGVVRAWVLVESDEACESVRAGHLYEELRVSLFPRHWLRLVPPALAGLVRVRDWCLVVAEMVA
jgi:hypothetical protein